MGFLNWLEDMGDMGKAIDAFDEESKARKKEKQKKWENLKLEKAARKKEELEKREEEQKVAAAANLAKARAAKKPAKWKPISPEQKRKQEILKKYLKEKRSEQPASTSTKEFEYVEKLKEIKSLLDAGIINEEDFEKMKQKIIDNMDRL